MKRGIKWIVLLFVLAALGCTPREEPVPPKIVTQIVVTCEGYHTAQRRFYNTDTKMRLILYHLRSIGIRDTPKEDPEPMNDKTIRITLTYADGSTKIYCHKGDRYFREDEGPWSEISPEKVAGLYQLIMMMPSDSEKSHLHRPHPLLIPQFTDLIF